MPKHTPKKRMQKRRRKTPRGTIDPSGKGRRTQIKLRYIYYADGIVASGGAGSHASVVRLNSVYDPEWQVGGQQPKGYDQYAQLYDQYLVHAASWRITRIGTSGGTTAKPLMQVVVPHALDLGTVTSAKSLVDLGEYPWGEFSYVSSTQGGQMPGTVNVSEGYMKMKTFFGVEVLDKHVHGAAVGANPSDECLLNVIDYNENGSNSIPYSIVIDIQYYVEFTEPSSIADT